MATVSYDFSCVPTVKAFFLSRKRIKCILGPFGCVSGDTEFLTEEGWKRIDQYSPGDKVAVWDSRTGAVSFEEPLSYIVMPCDFFYHFKNKRNLSMVLSPEHRVPLYDYRGSFVVKTAEEVARHPSKHTVPVNFSKEGPGTGLSVWMLRLGVAIQADGHMTGNKCVITVRKKRKIWRTRFLLNRCEIDFTEKYYPGRPNEAVISFTCPPELRGLKSFREWWGKVTSEEAGIIIDEVVRWDGGKYANNDMRYFSTNKECVDFIQLCAHLAGHNATISKREQPNHPDWSPYWVVHISKKGKRVQLRGDVTHIERVPGDRKYCFTTSTSFFIARHDGCIFVTGNSGKSSGCVISLLHYMTEQEPDSDGVRRTRYGIVRNTVKELKDTTKNTIEDWVGPFSPQWKESELKYIFNFRLKDGTRVESEWLLRALDRPDQVKDLLSLELTGAWINEAREIPKEVFDTLDGRIGRFPKNCTYPFIILDSNPPDTDSWLYDYFETKIQKDERVAEVAELFRQPSGLSPEAENIPNLPTGYYEKLMVGKDDDFVRVYIHGEYGFVREGKAVFGQFNKSVHVAKEELLPIKGVPLVVGMDFGLTPAAVITQFTPRGGFWVLDELVTWEPTSLSDLVDYQLLPLLMSKKYFGHSVIIIGDPAGRARSQLDKRNCFMLLRERNLEAWPAYTNSIKARIEAVNQFLTKMVGGEPAFQISPQCTTLIKALAGKYVFRRLRVSGERYTDIPEKNEFSHCADALQYAALGYTPYSHKEEDPWAEESRGASRPRLRGLR